MTSTNGVASAGGATAEKNAAGRPGTGLRAALRQWRYHREFRIAAPVWPDVLTELTAALASAAPATAAGPVAQPVPTLTPGQITATLAPKELARVATELWRMRRYLAPTGSPATSEARRALGRLNAVDDVLAELGVRVQEHDGDRYDTGQDLGVLAFQETDGMTEERVIETIRPSVYLDDQVIQRGEVVVGAPLKQRP